MSNDFQRRIRMDLWCAAEKAIYDAMQAVEAMPADTRLTAAVVLLGQAKDRVADFVDSVAMKCGHCPAENPHLTCELDRDHVGDLHEGGGRAWGRKQLDVRELG